MKFNAIAFGAALALVAGSAHAASVTDLIGDKDGLGIGLVNGDGFDYGLVGPGDGDGTDEWRLGSQSWTHTYSLAGLGALSSAWIEVGHGGVGFNAPGEIYIDGTLVGTLTDGDDVGPSYNYYYVDTFDLTPYLALINGSETIDITLVEGGDGWALDYSEIYVSDTLDVVPLPASLPLLAAGMFGLGIVRRRKQG